MGNIKVFYTLGQNFGNVRIGGEILLGPLGDMQTDGIKFLNEYFNTHRVSVLKKAITVSIGDVAYQVFLTGIAIGEIDKEFHILPFEMIGTLVDAAAGDYNQINPSNTLNTAVKTVESVSAFTVANNASAASTVPTTDVNATPAANSPLTPDAVLSSPQAPVTPRDFSTTTTEEEGNANLKRTEADRIASRQPSNYLWNH